MTARQITLIPGDGIGPEVADATVRAVDATGASIEWERVAAGAAALAEYDRLIPDDVFASLEITRVGLKGPTATPIGGGHQSINVALRKKLGLYTNFRPVRMLPGLKTRFHDVPVDLAIFRENTEDLYSGLEHEAVPGVVESLPRGGIRPLAARAAAWPGKLRADRPLHPERWCRRPPVRTCRAARLSRR